MRYLLVLCVACGAGQHPRANTTGSIAGLARDHDSGTVIASADVNIRAPGQMKPITVHTGKDGTYRIDHLAPGSYTLSASFAGQPLDVENITVPAGDTAVVDLTFTLGRPDPISVDFGNAKDGAIDRYRPAHHAPSTALIEGTVNDAGSRVRVSGAVVTAVRGPQVETLQTVTDDQGRYRFDDIQPGTYQVSAYYSIGGRGQIEVRRSDIHVDGAEAVVVPLWVEIAKQ